MRGSKSLRRSWQEGSLEVGGFLVFTAYMEPQLVWGSISGIRINTDGCSFL